MTAVLLIEASKPAIHVPPIPDEVAKVRADLERRRAARQPARQNRNEIGE